MTDEEFEALPSSYGNFFLTDAIRAKPVDNEIPIVLSQGYRRETYCSQDGDTVPTLMVSVSKESLFETFMEILDLMPAMVSLILETSHFTESSSHKDFPIDDLELVILKSHLYAFEELLLNDGCTGIAVVDFRRKFEIQFDEHKIIYVYAKSPDGLKSAKKKLEKLGIFEDPAMKFVSESSHVHSSSVRQVEGFLELLKIFDQDACLNQSFGF